MMDISIGETVVARIELEIPNDEKDLALELDGDEEIELDFLVAVGVGEEYERYIGQTTVTPKAYDSQVLDTQNKLVNSNINVTKVPFYQTSSAQGGGMTCYIATEVENV